MVAWYQQWRSRPSFRQEIRTALATILKTLEKLVAQDDDLTTAVTGLATAATNQTAAIQANTKANTDALGAIQAELSKIPTDDPVVAQAISNITTQTTAIAANNDTLNAGAATLEAAAQAILNPPPPPPAS